MRIRSTIFCIGIFYLGAQLLAQAPFTGKPRYQILTKRNNQVLGIFNIELFPNIAPKTTRNFDSLAQAKFFDTTAFHRVVPTFVIQGGDPNSRNGPLNTWGTGQPGQPKVKAEFTAAKHVRGAVSMARLGNDINSSTSQFFICVAAAPNLNNLYNLFGRVTSGMVVVDTIVKQPVNVTYTSMPAQKIEMFVTYIGSNDTVPKAPALLSPPTGTDGIDPAAYTQLKWTPESDGIIYRVEVSTDSTFATTTFTYDTGSALVNSGPYDYLQVYYWRVRTNNGGHFSPWSEIWKFSTWPVNGVGVLKLTTMAEMKVFPNPGNGRFIFENIPVGNRLEVFDAAGKVVFSGTVTNEVSTVDLEGKEKGVYLYRVTGRTGTSSEGKLIIK